MFCFVFNISCVYFYVLPFFGIMKEVDDAY